VLRDGYAGQLAQGRIDVERAYGHVVLAGGDARTGDEERHVDELAVERLAVAEPAVLHELVAVVGHEDDERLVGHAALRERREQEPDQIVDVADLAVVDRAHVRDVLRRRGLVGDAVAVAVAAARVDVHRPVRGGRAVRVVDVHVVQVEEERPLVARGAVEPLERRRAGGVAAAVVPACAVADLGTRPRVRPRSREG
jgi:hypothetical protein